MSKKTHVIWDSEVRLEDFEEFLNEEYPEITDEFEKWEIMGSLNREYLNNQRINLNIPLDMKIVCIADLGLWYGRRPGYRIIPANIRECLKQWEDCCEIYVDSCNDLRCTATHHDGTNYLLFREWRKNISETQKENFIDKILSGNYTRNDVNRYTQKLGNRIGKVYGW